jgi:hypothetical protein
MDQDYNCTLQLISNLAKPKWIPVKCNKELIPNIVCFKHHKQNPAMRNTYKQQTTACGRKDILKNDTCYLFLWVIQEEK